MKKLITYAAPAGATVCEGEFIEHGHVITRSPPSGLSENYSEISLHLSALFCLNGSWDCDSADHFIIFIVFNLLICAVTSFSNCQSTDGPPFPSVCVGEERVSRGEPWWGCWQGKQHHSATAPSIHTINASLITPFPVTQIAVKVQEETGAF